MKNKKKKPFSFFKFLASIKLAVIILIGLAVISAVGTFYESLYNADYAKKVVYYSFWMFFFQGLLAVNLIAVMVDRWPWKMRHVSFILAHIGIILMLIGSLQTYLYGIDGVMVFPLGSKNRIIYLPQKEISVFSSFDGSKYSELLREPVDLFKMMGKDGKTELSYDVSSDSKLKIKDYYMFAEVRPRITTSNNTSDGPALRFLIEGSRAKQSAWLMVNKIRPVETKQFGLAEVSLAMSEPKKNLSGKNAIFFWPHPDSNKVNYKLSSKAGSSEGELSIGDNISTGWMDFNLRLVNYKKHAFEKMEFQKIQYPHALSTEAVLVEYAGRDYWLGLDQPVKVFDKDKVTILTYGKQRYDIGFDLKLKNFEVGRYQGTLKAASYSSLVEVDGKERIISMNNPMVKNGLTFYQSSFQEDESGKPTHSILSVNRDPGRFLKYFGSLITGLGIVFLFYFRDLGRALHLPKKNNKSNKNNKSSEKLVHRRKENEEVENGAHSTDNKNKEI